MQPSQQPIAPMPDDLPDLSAIVPEERDEAMAVVLMVHLLEQPRRRAS